MTPATSQNVAFERQIAEDEDAWPLGEPMLRALLDAMRGEGLVLDEQEMERDGCWTMVVTVGGAALQLDLSGDGERWFGQIFVRDQPGALGRLFGKKVVDRSGELLQVAEALDRALRGMDAARIQWCVDGPPDEATATERPTRERRRG